MISNSTISVPRRMKAAGGSCRVHHLLKASEGLVKPFLATKSDVSEFPTTSRKTVICGVPISNGSPKPLLDHLSTMIHK
jgi:hypothetical protein